MTNRIPPSLTWLIDQRARLSSDVAKVRKALSKYQHLINKLECLEDSLAGIDKSLGLHEIKVDVSNIKPINTQRNRLKFPYGQINDHIISYIRKYGIQNPVSKSEVINYMLEKYSEIDDQPISHKQMAVLVKHALQRLATIGCIKRVHNLQTSEEGLWKSPEDAS